MKEREIRLNAIKDLITEETITSQEQLLSCLLDKDIQTTQATLSRDLKSLKVNKVYDGHQGYYYALPAAEKEEDYIPHYVQDIHRGFLSMDFSGNICLINTLVGHANPVAAALDHLNFEELLGTIAGDDTILAVMREGVTKEDFIKAFNEMLEKGKLI